MLNALKNLVRYLYCKSKYHFVKGEGVLLEKRNKKQWIYSKDELMGGKVARPVYFPNGIQESDLGTMESQAITAKDFWTCVSNSNCRINQIILEVLAKSDPEVKKGLEDLGFYDENGHINISQRALAVMSETVPGRGNSMYKVAETARKLGLVSEKFCPTLPGMTEWEYFNLPAGTYVQAKKFLELFSLFHEEVLEAVTQEMFTHGAIQVSVATPYRFVGDVIQPPAFYGYNHAVAQYGLSDVKKICDSYPEFYKKFSLNYNVGRPRLLYVQKKNEVLNYPLIQCNGGIYFLAKAGKWAGQYIGFEFGDNYKSHYGEYKDIKRVYVMKLPNNMARWEDGSIVKEAFISDLNTTGNKLAKLSDELNS